MNNVQLLDFFKTAYCFTDPQRNTAYEELDISECKR